MVQIVCLADQPWRGGNARAQQLMVRLKNAQVLYFEPPARTWRQQEIWAAQEGLCPSVLFCWDETAGDGIYC